MPIATMDCRDAKRVLDGVSRTEVEVRRGRRIFEELFAEMPDGGFVVKMDTEGFEQTILREIAAAKRRLLASRWCSKTCSRSLMHGPSCEMQWERQDLP